MRLHRFLPALLALALTTCAQGLPVHGKLLQSNETFTGTADGPADGNGTVTMTSSKGAKCTGNYTHFSLKELKVLGNLELKCDDGRTGGVVLTNKADMLAGIGTLGDDLFMLGE